MHMMATSRLGKDALYMEKVTGLHTQPAQLASQAAMGALG